MRVQPALARITARNPWFHAGLASCYRIEPNPNKGLNTMANTPQSKKRALQNEKRFAVNKARRSRIRTFLRKVEEAIASGNQEAAIAALRAAQPELMRGVSKGVFHKNTASRKMSRLAARVKSIG